MISSLCLKVFLQRRTMLLTALALALGSNAMAQDAYPNKPVKLIVPFAPGGTGDIVARLIGHKLGEGFGQSVVIENRGGAGSLIGTDAGAKAAPDGYTLTITNGAAITTGPLIGQKLPYKPIDDFVHVFLIGSFPNMLVVRADHPAKTLKQFLEISSKDPKGVSWGSAGVGSAGFLAGELLQQLAKISMVHVPYKGTGPAVTDLVGGSIGAMLTSPAVAASQISSGKLRALAVSSAMRLRDYPDVPTMNETIPGAIGDAWFGVSVPAKTPRPVIERIRAELEKVTQSPLLRAQLQQAGINPMGLGPREFDNFLRQETAKWAPILKAAKITIE
ncbi:Tripartite-type tricarboxylate transporter, receptor component TctC [Polaromonas sp. OV174]|uniref:Bug family tripartite tricarboxylate transporter substrate binding protein n=1 Tax=Polaromonas sp. OV174 TaxID=1855300 RepID=UPI0008E4C9BD|nr:tripartite tricarboxylate transporter substrate binding protein [Polaromonas sp. OV174]SFC03229.1 Tripartite-type tricarboxylate transporter, receptor component TctC [Polaromonas sp. OV174]